jgi:hypothetical protein
VVDDVSPLRELTAATLDEPLHLFPVPDATQHEVGQGAGSRFPGAAEFRGENAEYGALVTFSLHQDGLPHPDDATERERKAEERAEKRRAMAEKEAAGEAAAAETEPEAEASEEAPRGRGRRGRDRGPMAEIEVKDAAGEVIRTFETPVHLGVNRAVWDLRIDSFDRPASDEEESFFFGRGGPEVVPGTYTLTVRYGGQEASQPVSVTLDPALDVPSGAREAKYEAQLAAGALQERLTSAIERLRATRKDLALIQAKAKPDEDAEKNGGEGEGDGPLAEVLKAADKLGKRLDALEAELTTPEDAKGIPAEDDAWSDVTYALRALGSSFDAPTGAQLEYLARAERSVERTTAEVDRFYAEELPAFKAKVEGAGIGLLATEAGAGDG